MHVAYRVFLELFDEIACPATNLQVGFIVSSNQKTVFHLNRLALSKPFIRKISVHIVKFQLSRIAIIV